MLLILRKIIRDLLQHCFLKESLHIYCPGCGGTRAVFALLHLHFLQSLIYNPLPIFFLLYGLVFLLCLLFPKKKKKAFLFHLWLGMTLVFAGYVLLRDILLLCFGIDLLGDIL